MTSTRRSTASPDALAAASGPSPLAARAWLGSDDVVRPDGAVRSWANADHAGYDYPEAAGLLLSAFARDPARAELRERVARRLVRDVSPAGGVGRGGADYLFDTAIALRGLLDHARAGGKESLDAPHRLFTFIADAIERQSAVRGETPSPPGHWSVMWGSHLLKVADAIVAYDDAIGDARCEPLLGRLLEQLGPLGHGGRFVVHAASELTYVHACCYAIEGAMVVAGRGLPGASELAREGAAWLARAQDESGGMRAWHDGALARGPLRADATAQAVGIWSDVDAIAYARPIARALTFLRELQSPTGGLHYEPTSRDVNTWATIFAVSAVERVRLRG